MTSAIEHRTVTSKGARAAILACFTARRPVFLWGPPGIGKSEVVEDITKELGGHMIDLRLGQMDPTDIRGVPFYNRDLGVMDWAPPIDLPTDEFAAQHPVVVLFLDEMNTAAPAVQAAGYQLILNRRVGKYVLPDNVVIVAAGNRESDRGVTYRMPTPLANRFVHIEMRADFKAWQEWAINKGIHEDVVGFLTFAEQHLYDFDAKTASRAFATPRSWTFVSELLQDDRVTDTTLTDLVSGTIGEGLAISFMAHRRVASKLPDPRDILAGKVTKLETMEVSAMYSLVISMCYALRQAVDEKVDKKEFQQMADNFFRFMMDFFETELVVMGARVALTTYKLPFSPSEMKHFDEFHNRYGKFILQASQA